MRFNAGKLEIGKIPIRFSWFHHPLDPNLIVSDSAASIRDKQSIPHNFFGHAAGYDLQEVIHRSCYEAMERMLAFSPSFSERTIQDGFLAKTIFWNEIQEKKIPAELLLVRTESSLSSASGLGLHSDKNLAIEHAIYELIERDILCRIWYLDYQLYKIKNEPIDDIYFIEYYTVVNISIPFVLAIVKSKTNPIMYCGSRCSASWGISLEKAREEALLLITTINRLNTLYGETAAKQEEHLLSKLSTSQNNTDLINTNFKQIISTYLKNLNHLYVAELRQWGTFYLVKAFSDELLTKPLVRKMVQNNTIPSVPPDPFC
jgi:hypothetical protein